LTPLTTRIRLSRAFTRFDDSFADLLAIESVVHDIFLGLELVAPLLALYKHWNTVDLTDLAKAGDDYAEARSWLRE
jgi:hypothetical protein